MGGGGGGGASRYRDNPHQNNLQEGGEVQRGADALSFPVVSCIKISVDSNKELSFLASGFFFSTLNPTHRVLTLSLSLFPWTSSPGARWKGRLWEGLHNAAVSHVSRKKEKKESSTSPLMPVLICCLIALESRINFSSGFSLVRKVSERSSCLLVCCSGWRHRGNFCLCFKKKKKNGRLNHSVEQYNYICNTLYALYST